MRTSMKMKILMISAMVAAIMLGVAQGLAEQKNTKNKNIFSNINVGQKVSLKDNGNSYTIIISSVSIGHTITEIDENYIILKDLSDITETRIPASSIKSVVIQKLP